MARKLQVRIPDMARLYQETIHGIANTEKSLRKLHEMMAKNRTMAENPAKQKFEASLVKMLHGLEKELQLILKEMSRDE